jgi:hypothetical protein
MTLRVRRSGYKSRALGVALGLACIGCAASALAEDSGFWETIRAMQPGFRPVAPARGFTVVLPPPLQVSPVQIVRPPVEALVPASPAVTHAPPDPAKRENPLAALLSDPTLRYGDIAMFPDGPRVFRGEPGSRHSVHDFVTVAAARDMPPASRNKLLAMRPGANEAWSSDLGAGRGKLAGRIADVAATGSISVKNIGKTVTVRTGRGEVRIIRVPD